MLIRIDPLAKLERATAVALRPTCPCCRKPVHGIAFPLGIILMRCEYKHCTSSPRAKFRAIALAPGTIGATIAAIFGEWIGLEILRRCFPLLRELPDEDAYGAVIVPPGPTFYLTVLVEGAEYYRELRAEEANAIVKATASATPATRSTMT